MTMCHQVRPTLATINPSRPRVQRPSHFLSTTVCFRPDYRATRAFSDKKPSRLSFILSLSPLFSYTSPCRSSFLTSLWVSAPFLTLISVLVSRHNRRRWESFILCSNIAFSSLGAIRMVCFSGDPLVGTRLRPSPVRPQDLPLQASTVPDVCQDGYYLSRPRAGSIF